MKRRVILISNTAPFAGETFLRKELEWVPEDQPVTVFPIHLNAALTTHPVDREHIQVVRDASFPCLSDRLKGFFRALAAPFSHRELGAILAKPQPLRNFLKAVKFAFLSESRVSAIGRWLKQHYPGETFVFYSYWLYEAAYVAAGLKTSLPGSAFISRCHGYDLYEERQPNRYLPYRQYLFSRADGIYPVSSDGKRYLQEVNGTQWSDKIRVMRLGTRDYGVCTAAPGDEITVVSCSNLVDVKRVDKIISALALRKDPIRWHHFGDGPLMSSLREKASQLPGHIHWHFHGAVRNEELMEFYRDTYVDAFINVSRSEGVPVSIMEALSFGIPVIATDVGGTHEIVTDGENGRLLPPDFADEALLEAIKAVPGNKDYRAKARLLWEKTCDAGANYPYFYQQLL